MSITAYGSLWLLELYELQWFINTGMRQICGIWYLELQHRGIFDIDNTAHL